MSKASKLDEIRALGRPKMFAPRTVKEFDLSPQEFAGIKGQVTAVECGILSFEGVFMPYMLTHTGEPLIEKLKARELLAPPEEGATAAEVH